jgi:NADH:ubiquinone oxidoreductase subunit 5 (subunit L)/multisubunit Na+/H+ antiporter MnhA subunit
MIVGSIAAISQRDMKRMLAFSSIAHAGFILTAVVSLNQNALSATLFYLLVYGVATIGAFGVITLVRDSAGEVSDVNRWVGLGKKSPLVAAVFSLFLLSFAGIPLTSGFVGKFSIFSAAYESGNIYLVVAGVLSSAIAVFFYLRVILMLFFADAAPEKKKTIVRPRTIREIKTLQSFVRQYKSEPGKSLNESIKSMAKRDESFNEFLKNFKEKNEQGWANIIDLSQEEQERKLLEKTPEQRKNEMVMLEEFRRRKNLERYYKEMKE